MTSQFERLTSQIDECLRIILERLQAIKITPTTDRIGPVHAWGQFCNEHAGDQHGLYGTAAVLMMLLMSELSMEDTGSFKGGLNYISHTFKEKDDEKSPEHVNYALTLKNAAIFEVLHKTSLDVLKQSDNDVKKWVYGWLLEQAYCDGDSGKGWGFFHFDEYNRDTRVSSLASAVVLKALANDSDATRHQHYREGLSWLQTCFLRNMESLSDGEFCFILSVLTSLEPTFYHNHKKRINKRINEMFRYFERLQELICYYRVPGPERTRNHYYHFHTVFHFLSILAQQGLPQVVAPRTIRFVRSVCANVRDNRGYRNPLSERTETRCCLAVYDTLRIMRQAYRKTTVKLRLCYWIQAYGWAVIWFGIMTTMIYGLVSSKFSIWQVVLGLCASGLGNLIYTLRRRK